jgi:antitoxin component YwqK of YwqJK toxin-antitoxin module
VSELRVDVSDLKSESNLIKELAIFLEKKANVKVEAIANEIIVKGEEAISKNCLRALLKDFLKKAGVKGRVKKGKKEGTNLIIAKSKGKPILCGKNGKWKIELEQRLQKDAEIVLLALGDVKYEVLAYLNKRKDIEILKLETRQMKKREKGTGLKATVKRRSSQALP